jgi:hypothetical protein
MIGRLDVVVSESLEKSRVNFDSWAQTEADGMVRPVTMSGPVTKC